MFLKNMSNQAALDKHRLKCSGKQLFCCGICRQGFQSHNSMVKHTVRWHKADKTFKCTGVFVGRSKLQNSTNQSKNARLGQIFEKTHVPLISGLNHTSQLLTVKLKKEIVSFLKKEFFISNLMKFHLVLDCVLAKPEFNNLVKRMRYVTRSQSEKINRSTDLRMCVERGRVKLQKSLDSLENTPSGRIIVNYINKNVYY
jgi:hypothetical protein